MTKKQMALVMRADGLARQVIANKLGVSYSTIRRWTQPGRIASDNRAQAKYRGSTKGRYKRILTSSRAATRKYGYAACNATAEELENSFNSKCAICSVNEDKLGHRLHADHNHISGKFRGWLCARCNMFVGFAENNLDKVISYLAD